MIKKLSAPAFGVLLFTLCIVAQLPALFGGFEWADSGFYMTFYSNFFSNPEAVEYNFMYYLSGLVGGLILKIFPDSVLTMRVAGLLANLACVACVWWVLRERRWRPALLAGAWLLSLGTLFLPLTFYYDTLTALLICLSMTLLCKAVFGKQHDTDRYLVLAGFIIGINVFSRIPNVLDVLFMLLIPIGFRMTRRDFWLTSMGCWLCGWIAGLLVMMCCIIYLDQSHVFLGNLEDLYHIARSGSDTSHGMLNLATALVKAWGEILYTSLKLLVPLAVWWLVRRRLVAKWMRIGAACLLMLPAAWVLWRVEYVMALASVSVIGIAANLLLSRDVTLRFLSWIGLAVMLIMPIGSDGAIFHTGIYSMWFAPPVAMCCVGEVRRRIKNVEISFSPILPVMVVTVCSLSWIYAALRGGVYFDGTPLLEMTATPQTDGVRGLLTSPQKARIVDEIVRNVRSEVRPGETVMVYGSAPMIHYLTGTLPFQGNSWPEQLSRDALKDNLFWDLEHPTVLVMKFNTIGQEDWTPSEAYVRGEEGVNIYHNGPKTAVLMEYLDNYSYKPVKSTPYFTLYKRLNSRKRSFEM